MTYQDRFKAILTRMRSNHEKYNQINIKTHDPDEERIRQICERLWGTNTGETDFNIRDDLEPHYANRLLDELETILNRKGW